MTDAPRIPTNHLPDVRLKTYLGDSVYIAWDGYAFVLTTENGYGPSNTIVLEIEVIEKMRRTVDEWARVLEAVAAEKVAEKPDVCPDKDSCHGPMKWCDHCGDVGDVCDSLSCDTHQRPAVLHD